MGVRKDWAADQGMFCCSTVVDKSERGRAAQRGNTQV